MTDLIIIIRTIVIVVGKELESMLVATVYTGCIILHSYLANFLESFLRLFLLLKAVLILLLGLYLSLLLVRHGVLPDLNHILKLVLDYSGTLSFNALLARCDIWRRIHHHLHL